MGKTLILLRAFFLVNKIFLITGVGLTFQGCLLMVLILWKPTEDDPALFYVISAAWGVCNAIWEMLSFSECCLIHNRVYIRNTYQEISDIV